MTILLQQLLAELPGIQASTGDAGGPITCLTSDSRQVIPGALFVAYRGLGSDGHRFIPDALRRGAAAIVGELPQPGISVPFIQVADGRAALAWLVAAWYHHPSQAMALAGVTGTDGKTTTANILYQIVCAGGRRGGLISTVNAVIGNETYDTGLHTTTPDAPDVQRYLAQMRDVGTEIAILETTSHGLAQQRVTGCAFDVAVVTNITHEHLDYHGTYEAYRDAKAMLFRSLAGSARKPDIAKTAVLNRDDASYSFLAAIPVERTFTYGLHWDDSPQQSATRLTATNISHGTSHTTFDLVIDRPSTPGAPALLPLDTCLAGNFNVSNIMAAAGAALALGLPFEAIEEGVRRLQGITGRMERIDAGQPFLALVDFAHTPNALAKALATARTLAAPGGRVIVVFGSAGLRDRDKRRMMGEVAAQDAGYTVITAEDPRTESLAGIMAETAAACAAGGRVEGRDFVRIADRQRAILHAVEQAGPGDVVIACGKGHEQSMCFGTVEHPWRDQDAMRWALGRLTGASPEEPPYILPTWNAGN